MDNFIIYGEDLKIKILKFQSRIDLSFLIAITYYCYYSNLLSFSQHRDSVYMHIVLLFHCPKNYSR